jgi:hypothetical protein
MLGTRIGRPYYIEDVLSNQSGWTLIIFSGWTSADLTRSEGPAKDVLWDWTSGCYTMSAVLSNRTTRQNCLLCLGGGAGMVLPMSNTETTNRLERTHSLQDLILEAMAKDPNGLAWALAYKITLEKDVALSLPDNSVAAAAAGAMDSIEQMFLNRLID